MLLFILLGFICLLLFFLEFFIILLILLISFNLLSCFTAFLGTSSSRCSICYILQYLCDHLFGQLFWCTFIAQGFHYIGFGLLDGSLSRGILISTSWSSFSISSCRCLFSIRVCNRGLTSLLSLLGLRILLIFVLCLFLLLLWWFRCLRSGLCLCLLFIRWCNFGSSTLSGSIIRLLRFLILSAVHYFGLLLFLGIVRLNLRKLIVILLFFIHLWLWLWFIYLLGCLLFAGLTIDLCFTILFWLFRRFCGKVRGLPVVNAGREESVDINDVLKEAPLSLRLGINLSLGLLLHLGAGFELIGSLDSSLLGSLNLDLSKLDILEAFLRFLKLWNGLLL